MSEYLIGVVAGLVAALGATCIAWGQAHKTVANECEKLGAFYVGQKVYECSERKK